VKKIFVILMVLFSSGASCFSAGVGTGGSEFLKILPGTRSAGMGGSGMALGLATDGIYLNPSSLYLTPSVRELNLARLFWWQSVGYEYFAYMQRIRKAGMVGISYTYLHMPDLELTNAIGDPVPEGTLYRIYDMMLDISHAARIARNFYFGTNAKIIRRRLGEYGSNAFSLDAGCVYSAKIPKKTPAPSSGKKKKSGTTAKKSRYETLNFGLSVQNAVGTGIVFSSATYRDDFPIIVKLGMAYKPDSRLAFALDLDKPVDGNFKLHFGGEYWHSENFCFRAGYERMDDLGLLSGISAGFSVTPKSESGAYGRIQPRVDYAVRLSGEMGIVHRLAFRACFKGKPQPRRRNITRPASRH